jgi:hypothetical protein
LPYRRNLKSASDLVTSYEQTRAGFVSLALEKNRRATKYVAEARALKAAAAKANTPADLAKMQEIRPALLAAAGVSGKAANHLLPEDREEAIQGLIAKFLEPAGGAFVEELVFRFLLTCGDTLGGSMRNAGGALAQQKLSRALLATLTLRGKPYRWLHGRSRKWISMDDDNTDIELEVCGLAWTNGRKNRTLVYNRTVPLVKNNIDLVMLNCAPEDISSAYTDATRYVALGELKGGIDPAGADEHWKTARTALERIRKAFAAKQLTPMTFFIGGAIEKKMADEIWNDLRRRVLTNAANLTDQDQLASVCNWIAEL